MPEKLPFYIFVREFLIKKLSFNNPSLTFGAKPAQLRAYPMITLPLSFFMVLLNESRGEASIQLPKEYHEHAARMALSMGEDFLTLIVQDEAEALVFKKEDNKTIRGANGSYILKESRGFLIYITLI